MQQTVVLSALNAKYVHASPAPWCLAAGVQAYASEYAAQVRIAEATINQPPAELCAAIVSHAPVVVGLSCYIWNIDAVLTLCTALRAALPEVILVLGGPEVSYCAGTVLQNQPSVDYILAGEGERSFPAFLRLVLGQNPPKLLPFGAVDGLCGRHADGTVYESAPARISGAVPSPLEAGYAAAVQGRIAYLETSRGCPYSCAFCLSGAGDHPRFFALEGALHDLVQLSHSGPRTIKLVDRTFNANPAHANEILRFILTHYGQEIPQGTCFHFEIAGDIVREDTLALLAAMPAGAVQLEIGMQSFYEKTLEAVNRKTDTALLQKNIRRLVALGNMHIHIDLIAGLPHETVEIFAGSFNTAYALGAQMLQLGFLKLLHGSTMRSSPQDYPCDFDGSAPYEVRRTPWLSPADLDLLRKTEDALDRVYNSGRFRLTAAYVLRVSGQTPFEFYSGLGAFSAEAGVQPGISLDAYTAILQAYCAALPQVEGEILRDFMVRDRLATSQENRLPPCLYRQDKQLARVRRRLAENPGTAAKRAVRRSVALLYGAGAVCWADYHPQDKNPVTGRWTLHEKPLKALPNA